MKDWADIEAEREVDSLTPTVPPMARATGSWRVGEVIRIAFGPPCEVCGLPCSDPMDFLYRGSTLENPRGDGVRRNIHMDCQEGVK